MSEQDAEPAQITPGPHSHYCNICEGDWDHEGQCAEGPVACCPWCFPLANAPDTPGARRGAHFHFCPDCGQNWLHDAACSAPLRALCSAPTRAVLPEFADTCARVAERVAGKRSAPPLTPFASSRAQASRIDGRSVRSFIKPAVVPVAIAAGVILAIPILLKVSSTIRSRAPQSAAIVSAKPTAEDAAIVSAPASSAPGSRAPLLSASVPRAPAPTPPERAPNASSIAPPARHRQDAQPLVEPWGVPDDMVRPVPGALPRGGATVDTLLLSPRRLARASQPPQDLPVWSAESPRWDRAALSVLMRAVVDIRPSQDVRSPGSRGFIIDELGHVLTSQQRLGEATSLQVALSDGQTVGASVVARDRLNDIAVLRLANRGLPIIALGDSGALAIGDRVLAAGNDIGSDRAPLAATVLATGAGTGGNLAVDLTPKPAGVGGPLLNHLGEAVGILTDGAHSIGGQQRLTFAVPIDRVKSLLTRVRARAMAEVTSTPEGR